MNEEMRKEFEEWYEREGKTKPFTTVSIKDKMFDSWRASRESLPKIELPKKYQIEDDGFSSGYNCAIKESESVIIEAGYEVAE